MYAYNADVWCDDCAEKTIAEIDAAHPGEDQDTGDTDDYPQYATSDGEADCPQHCAGCGTFLENNLTRDGREYVTNAVRDACERGEWDRVALKEWLPFYDIAWPASVGEGTVKLVNPSSGEAPAFVLQFGAYGWTRLALWGDSLEDCLDEAVDCIADNAPGLLCDDQVAEAYNEAYADAIANGIRPERAGILAQEEAEQDTTCAGNEGHYILSHEWAIVAEDPTAEQWRQIVGSK